MFLKLYFLLSIFSGCWNWKASRSRLKRGRSMQHFLRCNLFLLHFLPHSLSPFFINALSIMVHCTTNCGQVVSLDTSIRNTQLLTKVLKNNCRRSWRRPIPGCSVCFGDLLSPALPPPTTLPTCFFLALGRYNMHANGLFRT